jgi:hypothetical protein
MAKCGGLPKMIIAVAEYYKKSIKKGMYLKLRDINENFVHNMEQDQSLSGLFSWMQSYMENGKYDIKPCLLYHPVFLGQNVRYRRLLRRWIAEGYVRDTSSYYAEENGLRLLCELLEFSMIHLHQSMKPAHLQVNGFFHEYVTSRPLEDNLCLALESPCSLNASQRSGPPAQHLTVRNLSHRDKAAFKSIDFSRLRSLTVFGHCKPFMFEIKMRYVRVLDLEDATGVKNDYLEQVVEVFPRLKFLSLRGLREISSLPKSFGALRLLQTLDVRHTSIATLPEAILELHKLQYVRGGTKLGKPWDEGNPTALVVEEDETVTVDVVSAPEEDATTDSPGTTQDPSMAEGSRPSCPGVEVPTRFGELMTLQTFGVANVGTNGVILKELPKLTELRRLAVCGINLNNIRDFFSAIMGLPHLKQLSVRLDKSANGHFAYLDDTIQRPPKSLDKHLKLHGHVRLFASSWIKEFATVTKLDLEVTLQQEEDMEVIYDQWLHHKDGGRKSRLCLKPIYHGYLDIGKIGEKLHLSILEIDCTTKLQATIVGNMPNVDVVKVHCSTGSSLLLSGLVKIDNLKEVWLKGSSRDDSLRLDLMQQLDKHPASSKPVLKLFD